MESAEICVYVDEGDDENQLSAIGHVCEWNWLTIR